MLTAKQTVMLMLVTLTAIVRQACCHDYSFVKIGVTGTGNFTPVATHSNVRAAIECGMFCKNHPKCLAYTFVSESCALYDGDADFTPAAESGSPAVYHVYRAMVVLGSLLDLTEVPGDNHQLYRGLAIKDAGRVCTWKFAVSQAGVVYLSVWRPVTSTNYELVGRTRAEVTTDQIRTLITLDVPETDRFDVEAGDVLGTFYDHTQNLAKVCIEESPNGNPALPDTDLVAWNSKHSTKVYEVGEVVAFENGGTILRCPQMALYLY